MYLYCCIYITLNTKPYTRYNGEEDKVYKLAAGLCVYRA